MALTKTELEQMESALQSAISTGSKRVKWGTKETEYQSLSEMIEALKWCRGEIARLDADSNGNFTVQSGVPIDS